MEGCSTPKRTAFAKKQYIIGSNMDWLEKTENVSDSNKDINVK